MLTGRPLPFASRHRCYAPGLIVSTSATGLRQRERPRPRLRSRAGMQRRSAIGQTPTDHTAQASGRGQGFITRADAMTTDLPRIPALRCVGCGGNRFIPLTFPRLRKANWIDPVLRPTAKCVTCGQCYFGAPNLPIGPSASAQTREEESDAAVSLRGRPTIGVAAAISPR
jgi:hypothetical protein